MKRAFSVLVLICLLAGLLAGCTGELPPLPALPGEESAAPVEDEGAPENAAVVTQAPAVTPETLELRFSLPEADPRGEDLAYYFSPAEEFDCGFVYPAYCTVWVEDGAIRFNPGRFFARMFFTSVPLDAEDAPKELVDLLEVDKWNTDPEEGTAGVGWRALRAMHLKYYTWRDWISWETLDRCYLLYGACFDGRETTLEAIFETIAESFRTGGELLAAAPESGTLLRQAGTLSLFFDGAALRGTDAPYIELRLRAANRGALMQTLSVGTYTADGTSFPFDEAPIGVLGSEEQIWTLSLPLLSWEDAQPCESIAFSVSAQGEDGEALFELPVRIEIN